MSSFKRQISLCHFLLITLLGSESAAEAFATKAQLVPSTRARNARHHATVPVLLRSIREDSAEITKQPGSSDSGRIGFEDSAVSRYLQSKLAVTDETVGLLVLLTVPVVWGTYVPVVRFLYEIDPPIPGFVFSVCYFALASLTTLSMLAFGNTNELFRSQPTNSEPIGSLGREEDYPETSAVFDMPILGGLELGGYLFLGNCLQVVGLKTVSADTAGFLVQLTTILVPLFSAIAAGNLFSVSARTWIACLIALGGITIMGIDFPEGVDSLTSLLASFSTPTVVPSLARGEYLIVAAAVSYTMHVVRLGQYARHTTPLKLAAAKATVETVLSGLLVLVLVLVVGDGSSTATGVLGYAQGAGREITEFFANVQERMAEGTLATTSIQKAVGATMWAGWVSTAYVVYAQSFGQQRVGASNANLIYSLQPIFTALFAYVLLGESMDPMDFVGGGLILLAVLLVASGPLTNEESPKATEIKDAF
jgi:drug/metabolite transporter (DMT)-like permease